MVLRVRVPLARSCAMNTAAAFQQQQQLKSRLPEQQRNTVKIKTELSHTDKEQKSLLPALAAVSELRIFLVPTHPQHLRKDGAERKSGTAFAVSNGNRRVSVTERGL